MTTSDLKPKTQNMNGGANIPEEDNNELDRLRMVIDKCDDELFTLLKTRCALSYKIGLIKKRNNLPIVNNTRFEGMVKDKVIRHSGELLTEKFIRKIYDIIHEHSCKLQQ